MTRFYKDQEQVFQFDGTFLAKLAFTFGLIGIILVFVAAILQDTGRQVAANWCGWPGLIMLSAAGLYGVVLVLWAVWTDNL